VKIGWDVLVELGMSDFELKERCKLSGFRRRIDEKKSATRIASLLLACSMVEDSEGNSMKRRVKPVLWNILSYMPTIRFIEQIDE